MNRFILSLIAIAAILAPLQIGAAEENARERPRLSVTASGVERVEATVADIRLAIEERGQTDEEARSRMARRSNTLLEYLRGAGVERLETASLRLHPIYDYTAGAREVVGYQAMSVIRFRSEVARAGEIIDEAIARGANQVQDLVFTAPETEIEEARNRALRTATRLAVRRAEAVLDELGLQIGEIVRIHINPVDQDPPIFPMRREARLAAADRPATDVEAGEPMVNASVTLEIAY